MTRFCQRAASLMLLILAGVTPLVAQTPTATEEAAPSTYIVQFVERDVWHNLYAEPDDQSSVVGSVSNGEELQATGDTVLVDETLWLPVQMTYGEQLSGWIERYYAVAHPSDETFCADEDARALVDVVQTAARARDGDELAEYVIPERGLYVGGMTWSESVNLSVAEVRTFFTDTTVYDWGHDSYTTETFRGTLSEVIVPLFDRDLLARNATIACNDTQHGRNIPGIYGSDSRMNRFVLYSVERPGTRRNELDWGAWAIGIDYWEGDPKLAYLSSYAWTP